MLKALFRKQFRELNSYIFIDRKTGKARSRKGVIGFAILYFVLYAYIGVIFYFAASAFAPLLDTEAPWLYAAFLGILALLYGVLGSAFNTYAGMYHAKDNDLLLSMPIPSSAVLLVRVSGVAMMGLLFESMVWIPAFIFRLLAAPFTAGTIIGYVVLYPVLMLLITVLSCFMGWVVALLSAKFKNRSILTVVFALLFIGLYYFGFSQAAGLVQSLLLHSEEVGQTIHTWLYPFYEMAVGAEGNLLHLLLFTLETAALLALTWFILTRTFIGIATRKESAAKAVYQEKRTKNAGAKAALLRKEWKRFLGSPTYMLNAGLGSVMLLLLGIAVFFFPKEEMGQARTVLGGFFDLLVMIVLGTAASMNTLTAPSVSLEGQNLWVLRTMPVPTKAIFAAKQKLHILYTALPVILSGVCVSIALKLSLLEAVLILVTVLAEVFCLAAFGLFMNLKMPMMTWTNETIPVKQSIGVLIAMLGGMGVNFALAAAGYALLSFLPPWAILLCFMALFVLLTILLKRWLSRRGVEIFESL